MTKINLRPDRLIAKTDAGFGSFHLTLSKNIKRAFDKETNYWVPWTTPRFVSIPGYNFEPFVDPRDLTCYSHSTKRIPITDYAATSLTYYKTKIPVEMYTSSSASLVIWNCLFEDTDTTRSGQYEYRDPICKDWPYPCAMTMHESKNTKVLYWNLSVRARPYKIAKVEKPTTFIDEIYETTWLLNDQVIFVIIARFHDGSLQMVSRPQTAIHKFVEQTLDHINFGPGEFFTDSSIRMAALADITWT